VKKMPAPRKRRRASQINKKMAGIALGFAPRGKKLYPGDALKKKQRNL